MARSYPYLADSGGWHWSDFVPPAVVNQVKYAYDDDGYPEQMDQDVDSVVGGSGARNRTVTFANTRVAPTNITSIGRCSVRRTGTDLADGGTIEYTFSSSSSLDHLTGRVTSVDFTSSGGSPTTVAEYEYLGRGMWVMTELNPGWKSSMRGATAGTFEGWTTLIASSSAGGRMVSTTASVSTSTTTRTPISTVSGIRS